MKSYDKCESLAVSAVTHDWPTTPAMTSCLAHFHVQMKHDVAEVVRILNVLIEPSPPEEEGNYRSSIGQLWIPVALWDGTARPAVLESC